MVQKGSRPSNARSWSWAAADTPNDAIFAVIGYPTDGGTVEWFPALAQRRNLTTWQGSEWFPAGGDRRAIAAEVAGCVAASCLAEADYYVLRPMCCSDLWQELTQFPCERRTYSGKVITVTSPV